MLPGKREGLDTKWALPFKGCTPSKMLTEPPQGPRENGHLWSRLMTSWGPRREPGLCATDGTAAVMHGNMGDTLCVPTFSTLLHRTSV